MGYTYDNNLGKEKLSDVDENKPVVKDRFCRIPPLEGSHCSQSIETECEMVGGWCRG